MLSHFSDLKPQSAYVHVPFCVHRCGYCDFTVIAGRDDLIGTYLDCLELELSRKLEEPTPVKTLFLGGGTPSYLPAVDLQRLMEILQHWLPVESDGEFSIECNPDGFTDDRMEVLKAAGIYRVSLGVQSFENSALQLLERKHTAVDVADVVRRLRTHGFSNVSLDLIFGVPDQSLTAWEQTLQQAVDLKPEHLSAYGLTFEKGTSFWTRLQHDQLKATPEELERQMYELVMEFLPRHGYTQYELSNYARPGFESAHNQVYWRHEPYYGFGPGAAELTGNTRRRNHQSVVAWIHRIQKQQSPVQEVDELDADLRRREAVMVGLRQTVGINQSAFQKRFQSSLRDLAPREYDHLIEQGLLEVVDDYLRLTHAGKFLADTVISEFF